jgi:hypothetical protein
MRKTKKRKLKIKVKEKLRIKLRRKSKKKKLKIKVKGKLRTKVKPKIKVKLKRKSKKGKAPRRNPRLISHSKPCSHCGGRGLVYSGVCSMCGGAGRIAPRRNPLTENRIVGLLCMAVWARGDAGEAQQARHMIIKQLNAATVGELPLIKTSFKKAVDGSTSQEGALEKLREIWKGVTAFPSVTFAELTGIASAPPPKTSKPKTTAKPPKPKTTKTSTARAPRASGRRTRRTEGSCILCGADSRGKPLCRRHYYESIGKAFVETCQHPGCEEPSRGQPLCRKHYYGQ